jgi:hypothetical protein
VGQGEAGEAQAEARRVTADPMLLAEAYAAKLAAGTPGLKRITPPIQAAMLVLLQRIEGLERRLAEKRTDPRWEQE